MAKKKKKFKRQTTTADKNLHVTEVTAPAAGGVLAALGASKSAAVRAAAVPADPYEMQRWWIAFSIAAALFGDHGRLDPKKDITGQTGNPETAAAAAQYTNTMAQALCTALSLRWDWVTTGEVGACTVVKEFVQLVVDNVVKP